MSLSFSSKPGRHERHFLRQLENPLMPRRRSDFADAELLNVQRLDHEELVVFLTELREKVQQAVDLKPNEESQAVLDLKGDLEKLYETAAGLADDHTGNKTAIRQLISVIMSSIRQNATDDALATKELDQEEEARTNHFHLLGFSLIADLLHPESLIAEDELLPLLLFEEEPQVKEALSLFDTEQLDLMRQQANTLLQEKNLLEDYQQRLTLF